MITAGASVPRLVAAVASVAQSRFTPRAQRALVNPGLGFYHPTERKEKTFFAAERGATQLFQALYQGERVDARAAG